VLVHAAGHDHACRGPGEGARGCHHAEEGGPEGHRCRSQGQPGRAGYKAN
jgi:hypothetical protein